MSQGGTLRHVYKSFHSNISRRLEAARWHINLFALFWCLACVSADMLWRRMPKFKAIQKYIMRSCSYEISRDLRLRLLWLFKGSRPQINATLGFLSLPSLHLIWRIFFIKTFFLFCWQRALQSPKMKQKCHIFVTGCTVNCGNDNFRCSQSRKFRQNYDICVSVKPFYIRKLHDNRTFRGS